MGSKLAGVGFGVATVIGWLVGAAFIVLLLAGNVYRTECTYPDGRHSTGWDLEGYVPYLWSPDDNHCQAHSLTRYVSGKVGIQRDIAP
jgi:hypothetical protein